MPESVTNKARRLLEEGHVGLEQHPVRVYYVDGDHGNYVVTVGANVAVCNCPAQTGCSHIEAAVLHWLAPDKDRERYDIARAQRAAEMVERGHKLIDFLSDAQNRMNS